jgi:hypothetical protein
MGGYDSLRTNIYTFVEKKNGTLIYPQMNCALPSKSPPKETGIFGGESGELSRSASFSVYKLVGVIDVASADAGTD